MNNEIYPLNSLFSVQAKTSVILVVSKVPIHQKHSEISCIILMADPSPIEPQLKFLETKPVVLPGVRLELSGGGGGGAGMVNGERVTMKDA